MTTTHKGLSKRRGEIAELILAGHSYCQLAQHYGCHKNAIAYQAKKAGVASRYRSGHEPHWITIHGERMRLQHAAERYGIDRRLLAFRLRMGDTGDRLIRPVRPTQRPEVYELGYSVRDWRRYAELGRDIGPRRAMHKTGVPFGAITAAMRGEEERLA